MITIDAVLVLQVGFSILVCFTITLEGNGQINENIMNKTIKVK